jgi:thiol-disulfide isomerase/thioredoxin
MVTTAVGQTTQSIQWARSVEQAIESAAASNKLVLLHFGANYCAPCRSLEQFVFSDPMVAQQLNAQFVPVKIDIQANPELAEKYAIARIPHDVILAPDGQPVFRRISPNSAANYRSMLQAGYQLALAATPQAQQAAEKISGMTQAEWEERVRSPFYGEEAARFGSLAAPPAGLPAAPQHNGTLTKATIRASQSNAPVLFSEGSHGPSRFPEHKLESREFPSVVQRSPQTLPEVQSSGTRPTSGPRMTGGRSTEIFPMAAAGGTMPAAAGTGVDPTVSASAMAAAAASAANAGQLTQPLHTTRLPGSRSQVTENVFFQPTAPQPEPTTPAASPVVKAEYRWEGGSGNGALASRLPTTVAPQAKEVELATVKTIEPPAPIGLEGYCPVSLVTAQQWVKGDPAFGCQHRGVLYLFASAEAQSKFMEQPDRLSPLLGGFDPVVLERDRHFQPGKRRYGVFCEAQPGQPAIVLFHSQETREAFKQDSLRYLQLIDDITKKADRNSRSETGAFDPLP